MHDAVAKRAFWSKNVQKKGKQRTVFWSSDVEKSDSVVS